MKNPIVFYGERGLVNGFVMDISPSINLTKKFLKEIRFCEPNSPAWIDRLQRAVFLVEPSFSEFGNPDLMIICDCTQERHVVFIEAKVVKYEDSAISLIKADKKDIPGINSRINSQLTLKYRLSLALKNRKGKEEPIEESEKDWLPYSNLITETSCKPRRLLKKDNLRLCDDFLTGTTDFWFVALTADSETYRPFKDEKLRPLTKDSGGADIWDQVKDHFGLVTISQLDTMLFPNGNYSQAREYYPPPGKPMDKQPPVPTQHIRTENWSTFGENIRLPVRQKLQQVIEASIDSVLGPGSGRESLVEYNGSDSYLSGQRTLIKLIPRHTENGEKLTLAVLDGIALAAGITGGLFNEGPYSLGIGKNARNFYAKSYSISPEEQEISDLSLALKEFWRTALEQ